MTDFLTRYTNEPLDGKYRLIERLGAGGMGEVFKAEHVFLGATRVIKIVRPQISASTEAHERFVREARLATKVHHHNVATLHDFASLPDGAAYMVWEFIDGENLSQLLRKRGQLAPRLVIRLAAEALAGLDAIHRAGIVHRDISPENIMIARDDDGEEHVKIIDLGVAKADEGDQGMTRTGMFIGKLRYASPEHLGFLPEGERIDGRADLYSLAIVIYEMLTGRAPFEATSPHQYYVRYSRDEALTMPDLASVPGGPELQSVLSRALERDRNRRFANAREFSEALQRAAAAIPDERSLPTMALPVEDADATMKMGTQSPFATTVRTDHGAVAPPTVLTPLPESVVYTPPPPPAPAPPPPAPAPVVARPGGSKFLPIALAISVLLIVAFVGLLAYATKPLWWKKTTTAETTTTTTQAAVVPPPVTTAPTVPPSTTTVDVTTTTSAPVPQPPVIIPTTTTAAPPPPTTTTVAQTKPKPPLTKPQPQPVAPPPPTETTETEETEAPAPAPAPVQSASIHTFQDTGGDSTWNSAAVDFARKQLAGVKSVAVQGSSSGDPALVEELERLLTKQGLTISPSADTVIKFHGKLERRGRFAAKTRFADATVVRHGRVVFHYQLPLGNYHTGDDPAEAFARVAGDLFR
ncbi:MAG TPA: serine/threonine-protein kinase [Thermoanaerobaculia bacterium]|nr:serine/threonine-protein kinase [Thermoanaerobaculia bacterium]